MVLPPIGPDPPGPLTDPHDLYWLIRIRWLVVGFLFLGAVGTWMAGTVTTTGLLQSLPLLGGIGLYNLAFLLALRAAGARPDLARWRTLVRWLQQPCDIVVLTVLLHLIPTGGITPLTILYGVMILAAVVILPPRGIYAITVFALLCYTGLVIYEFYVRPATPAYTLLFYLRSSPDAARIAPNAIVMMVLALGSIAFIAGRFAQRLRSNQAQIRRQLADLTELHAELHERARRDSLTGALNHGALLDKLGAAIGQAAPTGAPVALIMLDVDYFKPFNDRWGHQAGDIALRALTTAIEAGSRTAGAVGRWGGEEFAVVLPGLGPAARAVADRIGQAVAATAIRGPEDQRWPTPTVSQGIACFPQDAATAPALVDAADRALYAAKAQGRNSIVASSPPLPTTSTARQAEEVATGSRP